MSANERLRRPVSLILGALVRCDGDRQRNNIHHRKQTWTGLGEANKPSPHHRVFGRYQSPRGLLPSLTPRDGISQMYVCM